jgi:hypothetical protein
VIQIESATAAADFSQTEVLDMRLWIPTLDGFPARSVERIIQTGTRVFLASAGTPAGHSMDSRGVRAVTAMCLCSLYRTGEFTDTVSTTSL